MLIPEILYEIIEKHIKCPKYFSPPTGQKIWLVCTRLLNTKLIST